VNIWYADNIIVPVVHEYLGILHTLLRLKNVTGENILKTRNNPNEKFGRKKALK